MLDIEDAFRDVTGRLLLSKTAASQIGERLRADYQEFAWRNLSSCDFAYLFVVGIAECIRPANARSVVLAAWGLLSAGGKVSLMAGSKENTETVTAYF